jgi:Asp-tRNA(Asn)/Glu-tRNA(Gln) amidotransferase A subunit family amidase
LDLRTLTLVDTLALLKNGTYTSETLTRAFLAQVARYEKVYNAFTFLNPHAIMQARASDEYRASGKPERPMEGVPVAIKVR